jgi:hypothetical protein
VVSSDKLADRLAGAKAKLDRAEEQLDAQDREWVEWREREEPWGADCEVGDEGKRLIFVFKMLKPVPLRFGVIAGEIVHDMRSALDHLASYLVELHGSKPTLTTAWPLEPSSWGWARKVERRRRSWQIWRKKGGGPLSGIPRDSDAWALIKRSQPYIRSDQARDDPLWTLHQLWNADKHRALHAIPIYPHPEHLLKEGFTFPSGIAPIESKVLVSGRRPLRDGLKLAVVMFDRAVSPMQVQITLRVDVALSDNKDGYERRGGLRETLQIIRGLYEDVRGLPNPPHR